MYEDVRVKQIIKEIYREHGKDSRHRGSAHDAGSCNSMELVARRKAYRSLETSDRITLDKMIDRICEKTHLGTDAALGILMHIGVFINTCARRTK